MMLHREKINPLWKDAERGKSVRLFQPLSKINRFPNVLIMSVELTKEFTRIDFQFTYDIDDVQISVFVISPEIKLVIREENSIDRKEKNYELINSENAPVYPLKYSSESNDKKLYFTLYFAPLPLSSCEFDIVEDEDEDECPPMNFFNINFIKGERFWLAGNSEN